VVTAINLGLRSLDLEPTQRRAQRAIGLVVVVSVIAVVKGFYIGW